MLSQSGPLTLDEKKLENYFIVGGRKRFSVELLMWSAIWVGLYKGGPKSLSEADLGLSEICPMPPCPRLDMSMAQ